MLVFRDRTVGNTIDHGAEPAASANTGSEQSLLSWLALAFQHAPSATAQQPNPSMIHRGTAHDSIKASENNRQSAEVPISSCASSDRRRSNSCLQPPRVDRDVMFQQFLRWNELERSAPSNLH